MLSPTRPSSLVAVPLALLGACTYVLDSRIAATPQRPTLSSDTATAAPGTVEIEAGATVDPAAGFDSPVTVRAGLSDRTEAFVGWSPFVYVERRGEDAHGAGDVQVGVRHRFLDETDEFPSAGFLLVTKLPAASTNGIGSGEVDFRAAGIANKSFETFALNGFYQIGGLGDPAGRGIDIEHAGSAGVSLPLDDRWGAFGELAGVLVPEADFESWFATGGVTYQLAPSMVVDAAVVVGISEEAPDFQLLIGITTNLGRLWHAPGIAR